jgi:hypothetical protein
MRAARKYPPSHQRWWGVSPLLLCPRRPPSPPFSRRLLVSWCAVALPLSLLSLYPLRSFAHLPRLVLVVVVLAVWFSSSSSLSSPSLSSSCPRVFVVGGWWTAPHCYSTHDPPHEQLLMRLGVGGVSLPSLPSFSLPSCSSCRFRRFRHRSTHDPPHEQLLVRLGMGGVSRDGRGGGAARSS